LVEMRDIVKSYSDVLANDHVSFEIRAGEIHALLGENGAGKTTLMSVLCGMAKPDQGEIRIRGALTSVGSPREAIAQGIGMVHQHFKLVPTLTVAENFALGEEGRLTRRRLGQIASRIESTGREYGLEVRPMAPVWQLSVGEQQRVEILRALYRGARILLLDEPTATLAPPEVESLLARLRGLRDSGSAIVLVTHHLEDVMACADRITVLRRGRGVGGSLLRADASMDRLVRLMVGEDPDGHVDRLVQRLESTDVPQSRNEAPSSSDRSDRPDADLLVVSGLRVQNDRGQPALHDLTFSVDRSEIVAIAGVEGNGQAELEEALVGLRSVEAGSIRLSGQELANRPTGEILRTGIALIPSDRFRRGLIAGLPVVDNLALDRFRDPPVGSRFLLRRKAIVTQGLELLRRYAIRVAHPMQRAAALSGGNAQRVVLARALSARYSMLVCGQPTRGLDVRATADVMGQLASARDQGAGILLISTDLREVFALADRCLVIYRGQIIAAFEREAMDFQRVGAAMGGLSTPERVSAQPPTGEGP